MSEERRLVTVMFADAVGSTSLGESLDPEDVRALMARYFAIAREVVENHDGTIEKFIGDAVMAVFGLPRAHGDDAERALDAALELRDAVQADPVLGERLPIRLGVNTGDVVAGPDAAAGGDALITGDAVNVAARLQQAAEPWTIVCGERSIRAGSRRFAFGPLGDIDARGRSVAVGAAVLLGRIARPEAPRTRIVGRDADLEQLDLVARRTFRERRPYLVTIIAPPGTGKTRLLEEFLARLPGLSHDAGVAVAQCLPYGQRLTYWPMRALLLDVLGLPANTHPEAIRGATSRWLESLDDADAERHAELLAATIGAGEGEATDRTEVFTAWRTAIELAAVHRPLVLVVEDLHWSSDSLLDLVEAILQPRADAPVLMIALSRPELLDRRPGWGGGRRNHVALALEPLDDYALAELVGDLLDVPVPEIVQAVVARADGNPFYAGELVRAVLERSGSINEAGAVERALASLPDTVQGTVLARLDLLPPVERRVLQLGAVFGRSFRTDGLQALAPEITGDLEAALDGLRERDLIRTGGPDESRFRHILIREVAYSTLPRAERSRLHAGAGAVLELHAGGNEDALAELIAYHLREAVVLGRSANLPDLAELQVKAVRWLRRAAEAAMAAAATIEASRHVLSAIDLAGPDDLPELYEFLGDSYQAGPGAVDAYHKARELAKERGRSADDQLRILTSELLVVTRWHGSVGANPIETIEALRQEGRRLVSDTTDERTLARFLIGEAFLVWVRIGGRAAPSDETDEELAASGQRALEIGARLDDVALQSAALDAMSSVVIRGDDYRGSLVFIERRLALGDRLDFTERFDAEAMRAWHEVTLGDIRSAVDHASEAIADLAPGQAPGFVLSLSAWLVAAFHVVGRWDEAIAAANRLERVWEDLDRPPAGFAIQGFLAELEVARARREEALTDRAVTAVESIIGRFSPDDRIRGLLALVRPDPEAVERDVVAQYGRFTGRIDHLDRALAICSDRGHRLDAALLEKIIAHVEPRGIRLIEAQARRALGLTRQDPEQLRLALGSFSEMGAVPYGARVRIELGQLAADAAMIDEGVRELETIGDVDQLGRIRVGRDERSTARSSAVEGR
jgi:class 3 adenylate cyclase